MKKNSKIEWKKHYRFPCQFDISCYQRYIRVKSCLARKRKKSNSRLILSACYQGGEKKSIEKRHWSRSTTPMLPSNDRSIDREEHAAISERDLLTLVQLGEICENVYTKAPNRGPSSVSIVASGFVVSIRVLIRNEGSVREITCDCSSLNVSRLCKFYDT